MYYLSILSARMKSGNTGAKAERRLTPWVLHRRGLRRAKALLCQTEEYLKKWGIKLCCSRLNVSEAAVGVPKEFAGCCS